MKKNKDLILNESKMKCCLFYVPRKNSTPRFSTVFPDKKIYNQKNSLIEIEHKNEWIHKSWIFSYSARFQGSDVAILRRLPFL